MNVRMQSAVPVVVGLLLAAGMHVLSAGAVEVGEPTDFEAVQGNVSQVQSDLATAQCGGWDFTQSVENKVAGAKGWEGIAYVVGAPGRKGVVFEDGKLKKETAVAGLAWRDETSGTKANGYLFPASDRVNGFTSVCKIREFDGDDFPYKEELSPASYDPATTGNVPCKNRDECQQICLELNYWQFPRGICPGPPPRIVDGDCRDVRVDSNPGDLGGCPFEAWHYCCSTAKVTDVENDPDRNCISCEGDGLGTPADPAHDGNGQLISGLYQTGCRQGKTVSGTYKNESRSRAYTSFFRQFRVSYDRRKVDPPIPDDDTKREDIPVMCYGRYEEFDPKAQRTKKKDRRCIIISDYNNMKSTQRGKGDYGQNSFLPDPTFPRPTRDTLKDLWVTSLSDAFSLLNGKKIQEKPKDNLFPLLQLDSSDLRATAQLDTKRLFSSGSLLRATDDSVHNDHPGRRTLTEWWQEQETQAHRLFTPPILRLILPTPASDGLDLSDPLLVPAGSSSSSSSKRPIPERIIDLQIRAEPADLVSEVSAYLGNSLLLHVREEPVRLVVPLASPVELRALAQGWKRWGDAQGPGEAQTKALAVAAKLEEYAERIDKVRALRGELAQYVGRLLKYQSDMSTTIAQWIWTNLQAWDEYGAAWSRRLSLQPRWKEIQQKYRAFHDKTNLPWCRDERYTTPIYSFLDDWMPGPENTRDLMLNINDAPANNTDPLSLPRLSIDPLPDLVYDFTALRVETGTVVLPVLSPIQVRLNQNLLNPPDPLSNDSGLSARLEELMNLPDLPPVPTIFADVLGRVLPTEMLNPASPTQIHPSIPDLPPQVEEVFTRILTMFTKMTETYQKFWDSLVTYPGGGGGDDKWDCKNADTLPCVHVEMDLLERFTRIAARPAVLLKEDFESIGLLRTAVVKNPKLEPGIPSMHLDPPTAVPPCPREDWACQVFSAEKTYAREGWRVEGVKEGAANDVINELRNRLRTETLPSGSSSSFPYIVKPKDILPSFSIPAPIRLPGPSSS